MMLPTLLNAQPPIIQGLSRTSGTYDEKVTISGSNFSNNQTDLVVFFGGVRGTIVSSTNNTIIAKIPTGATTGNIIVLNKTNGLQASSIDNFYISFSGSGFSTSQLGSEINIAEATELFDLCLCDFNNDNRVDIAATKVISGTDINVYKNISNPGNISFQKLNKLTNSELDLLSTTSNISCGDLDGDGLHDLVVTKSGNPRNVVYVLRNISSGSAIKFALKQSYFLPPEDVGLKVLIKDLDRDGKPELIVTNTFDEHVSIFQNKSNIGTISFNIAPIILTFTGSVTTAGLAVEDLNNDGYPEIAVNPYIEKNILIAVNQSIPGNISFSSPQTINLTGNLNNMTWGDYNGDGKIDLAATKTIQGQVVLLINQTAKGNNTISFNTPVIITTGSGPWGISTADMDGNGKPDLIVGLKDTRGIDYLKNSDVAGVASFTRVPITTVYFTRNIFGNDLDGDARPDFIYTSFDVSPSKYNMSLIRNTNCFVPKVTPSQVQILCPGGTISLTSNNGYNTTYRWDRNNVVVKDTIENFYDVILTGTFKVLGISDGGACQKVSNAIIVNSGAGTIPANPVITNTGPYCIGDTIKLNTNAVTGGVYAWTGPDGFTSSIQNITIPNSTSDMAGIYSLKVSVGSCSSDITNSTVELTVMPEFVAATNDPTTFCIGNFVALQATNLGGYSYQWMKNNVSIPGATTPNYNANENGTFNAVITSNIGLCKVTTNSFVLTSIEQPNANYSINGNSCIDQNLTFINTSTYNLSQPVNFTWLLGDGSPAETTKDVTHSYPLAGSYTISLKVAYQNGACEDSISKVHVIFTNPTCSISELPSGIICQGIPKTLTVDPDFVFYGWNTLDSTKSIVVTDSGVYSVTVTDINNCISSFSLDVKFFPKPDVIVAKDSITITNLGVKVQLEAFGASSFNWDHAEQLDDAGIPNPIATVSEDTTLFTVVGNNSTGCTDTATVLVLIMVQGNTIDVVPAKLFSPNGDGIDDNWVIQKIELYPQSSVSIYNGTGSIVKEAKPYNNDWNGGSLPEGVYYYIIKSQGKESKTGSITVIR